MMESEHRAVVVPPGEAVESVVVRWRAGVVVLGGQQDDVDAALATLRPDGELEPAGGLLIERLRMLRHGDVAAGVSTPGGYRLFSSGRGVAKAGDVTGEGRADAGMHEVDVDPGASPVWIGMGSIDDDLLGQVSGRSALDLVGGTVPGRGVLLVRPPSAPLDPRGDDVRNFDVVDFGAEPDDAERQPLPIERREAEVRDAPKPLAEAALAPEARAEETVLGIECSRQHFNNPSAAYCQVCGISMVHITHNLVRGERPTLGFLVFDDGATFALDRSYVIGREPSVGLGSMLAPLTADDNEHTVSRSHAELVLDGWDVTVADLGSTNGTFVWRGDRREWERVLPNRPAAVPPGTSVAVGRKTFVYEPVARSV